MATENLTLSEFFGNQRNPFSYSKFEQVNRDITTSWLTLNEITEQLNNWGDESQDSYLQSLEVAVRMTIEDYLGKAVFPIQYKVYYGNAGLYNTQLFLDLPETGSKASTVTVNAVEYYASSNTVPSALASSAYFYDPTGNRVVVTSIPTTLNPNIANPIVVTYTQNADFFAQYPVVKQAALLLFTHLYNNRSNSIGGVLHDIPYGMQVLLRPYKDLVM